jgi:hypothetical protein
LAAGSRPAGGGVKTLPEFPGKDDGRATPEDSIRPKVREENGV